VDDAGGRRPQLGPYPHARLNDQHRKKQAARLLKAACPNPQCEIYRKYGKPMIGRFSQEIADIGLPYCAGCGSQMVLARRAGDALRKVT
jgi:hypothetical protein